MSAANESQGMSYLDSISRRWFTTYVPIGGFLIVLLFPFYWMAITAFKPNAELLAH
ncbi:MAG: carbohydrate ABC transporter permease, partial [Bryobacteraceae bacterium]